MSLHSPLAPVFTQEPDYNAPLAQSLGMGLNQYIGAHLQDMLQQKSLTQRLPGLQQLFPQHSPETLQSLASLDPNLLREVYKSEARRPGEEAFAQSLAALLGGQAPNIQGGGLNQDQALKLAELYFQKQQQEANAAQRAETSDLRRETAESNRLIKEKADQERRQKRIEAGNKPYLAQLAKGEELATNMINILDQMQALYDTGKVRSGIKGRLPSLLQNTESQQFEALGNDLAALVAANGATATDFKLKFAQNRKPNLTQRPETQQELLNKIRKDATRVLDMSRLRDDLILSNEGIQPENIHTLINRAYKETKRSPGQNTKVETLKNDSTLYGEGDEAIDESTGQVKQIFKGGRWVKV